MDRHLPNGESPNGENGTLRVKFLPEEDAKLKKLVEESFDRPNWREISIKMHTRTPRQCRERYKNYLSPEIQSKEWTDSEDRILLEKYNELGHKWNTIASYLPGRTGNSTRNRMLAIQRKNNKVKSPKEQPLIPTPHEVPQKANVEDPKTIINTPFKHKMLSPIEITKSNMFKHVGEYFDQILNSDVDPKRK